MEQPSKEAWESWVHSSVTQWFLNSVHNRRELLKESLAEGRSDVDNLKVYIGRCMGMKDVLQYAIQDFDYLGREEDQNDDQGS